MTDDSRFGSAVLYSTRQDAIGCTGPFRFPPKVEGVSSTWKHSHPFPPSFGFLAWLCHSIRMLFDWQVVSPSKSWGLRSYQPVSVSKGTHAWSMVTQERQATNEYRVRKPRGIYFYHPSPPNHDFSLNPALVAFGNPSVNNSIIPPSPQNQDFDSLSLTKTLLFQLYCIMFWNITKYIQEFRPYVVDGSLGSPSTTPLPTAHTTAFDLARGLYPTDSMLPTRQFGQTSHTLPIRLVALVRPSVPYPSKRGFFWVNNTGGYGVLPLFLGLLELDLSVPTEHSLPRPVG